MLQKQHLPLTSNVRKGQPRFLGTSFLTGTCPAASWPVHELNMNAAHTGSGYQCLHKAPLDSNGTDGAAAAPGTQLEPQLVADPVLDHLCEKSLLATARQNYPNKMLTNNKPNVNKCKRSVTNED